MCVHAYTHIYKQVDPRVPPTQLPLVNEKYKQKHRFHPKKKNREKKLMAKSRYRKPAPSSKDSLKMPLSLSRVHSQWQRLKRVLHLLKLYMRMEIFFFKRKKRRLWQSNLWIGRSTCVLRWSVKDSKFINDIETFLFSIHPILALAGRALLLHTAHTYFDVPLCIAEIIF